MDFVEYVGMYVWYVDMSKHEFVEQRTAGRMVPESGVQRQRGQAAGDGGLAGRRVPGVRFWTG